MVLLYDGAACCYRGCPSYNNGHHMWCMAATAGCFCTANAAAAVLDSVSLCFCNIRTQKYRLACANAMQIALYQAMTGRLCWVLGSHEGIVYSINWAKDDSSIITASADYTAKVWHLPLLPSPAHLHDTSHHGLGVSAGSSSAGLSTAAWFGAAAAASSSQQVVCTVLQHKCFVYAAELHPEQQPLLLAVTGGYDGVLRVWSAADGQQLSSLQVNPLLVTGCLQYMTIAHALQACM